MRRVLLDVALAVLALVLLVPVGLLAGWRLSRAGPGELVEVEVDSPSRHAGSSEVDLSVGRTGARTVWHERLRWYTLGLPSGDDVALLTPVDFAFFELVRFEGQRLVYEDGPTTLVVEVRP